MSREGAVAFSLIGEGRKYWDELAFVGYMKCLEPLDEMDEDLICEFLQRATLGSGNLR